jgi:hypothetical protein
MITKEQFIKFIKNYQTFYNGIERFEKAITGSKYTINLFETDWGDAVGIMLDTFLDSHFTDDGADLLVWWLFEDVDKIITQTVDPDLFHRKSEIEYNINDIEDLWNYLTKFSSDYFKQDLKVCKP